MQIEETSDTIYKILTTHAQDKGIKYEVTNYLLTS